MPRTDFAGWRLRAHAAALRADLIREVEGRLLKHLAIEACPKPFHLLVPQSATGPARHFAAAPSAFCSGTPDAAAAEDHSTHMASCVITGRGELLVVDHTDDGLVALRPRSLGFLVPGTVLPPEPDLPIQGPALRRYPFILPIHRPAFCLEGLVAGRGAVTDLAQSQMPEVEKLRLFAPSRSQFDALRRAVECWSTPAETVRMQSKLDGISHAPVEKDLGNVYDCDRPQPEVLGAMHRSMTLRNRDTVHVARGELSGPSVAKSASEQLREQIAAARESLSLVLSCSPSAPSPPVVCTLSGMTTTTEDADKTIAAKISYDDVSDDISEIGRRLTERLELRAGAAALLAGLDTAVVLEIDHFVKENAHSRMAKIQACVLENCEESANATATANPVLVSGMPVSQNFAMISVQEMGDDSSSEDAALIKSNDDYADANTALEADPALIKSNCGYAEANTAFEADPDSQQARNIHDQYSEFVCSQRDRVDFQTAENAATPREQNPSLLQQVTSFVLLDTNKCAVHKSPIMNQILLAHDTNKHEYAASTQRH